MSDLNLILQALATGATAALPQTAGAAIKDAYSGLKALIQSKFADQPKAQIVLEDYEDDPGTYEKPLSKFLSMNHLDQDEDIIAASQQLMNLIQPQQVGMGKFTIQNMGTVQGQVIGDHPTVTQYYKDHDEE